MNSKGKGGVRTGIVITASGLLMMLSPPVISTDLMDWGYAVMFMGIMVFAVGITTFMLYRHRRKVLNRMAEDREVLARWTYDADDWRKWQKEEVETSRGMPIIGAILGGIFVIIGLIFFLSDPDDMALMLALMAGIGALIAFVAWLSTALRRRAVLNDPGEVIIARGGVYFMGFLTDWNGVTSWFDIAKVEKKGKRTHLTIRYRFIAGRYAHVNSSQICIPVPTEMEEAAKAAASKLNSQPY